ncbi:MAG: hypothetical protein ACP5M8_05985 [Caldisphaera sp.]
MQSYAIPMENWLKDNKYKLLTDRTSAKIFYYFKGNPLYIAIENDWPMLYLSKVKQKLLIINHNIKINHSSEIMARVLEPNTFKVIGNVIINNKNSRCLVKDIDGNLEYTWYLIDIHSSFKLDPLQQLKDLIKKIKPKLVATLNLFTDPLSIYSFNMSNIYVPPLIYGSSNSINLYVRKYWKNLNIELKFSDDPITFSYPKDDDIIRARSIMEKIFNIGF